MLLVSQARFIPVKMIQKTTYRQQNPSAQLLSDKGTYALKIHCLQNKSISVGRLGILNLEIAYYIYVGSAFGPGGVKARVSHHFNKKARQHWHIDYITNVCDIESVWYTYDPAKREHFWVETVANLENSQAPFPGFGASDHRGNSHLFSFQKCPSLERFRKALMSNKLNHEAVFELSIK